MCNDLGYGFPDDPSDEMYDFLYDDEEIDGRMQDRRRERALAGDPAAQTALGLAYYSGRGIPRSREEAFRWLSMAAEQGEVDAQVLVAEMYSKGLGVERSPERAFEWNLRAAEAGDVGARYSLAVSYETGRGVERSDEEAYGRYLDLAEDGDPDSMLALAEMCRDGRGREPSEGDALMWYEAAARAGDADAAMDMADRYLEGRGVGRSYEDAFELYGIAARGGARLASYMLGRMYEFGLGVEQSYELAARMYREELRYRRCPSASRALIRIGRMSGSRGYRGQLNQRFIGGLGDPMPFAKCPAMPPFHGQVRAGHVFLVEGWPSSRSNCLVTIPRRRVPGPHGLTLMRDLVAPSWSVMERAVPPMYRWDRDGRPPPASRGSCPGRTTAMSSPHRPSMGPLAHIHRRNGKRQ